MLQFCVNLTIFFLFCTTVSAQAVPDSQDHSAHQHHQHHQQTVQPELVIKPIGLNTLNIHEKNNVVLSIKDKLNNLILSHEGRLLNHIKRDKG